MLGTIMLLTVRISLTVVLSVIAFAFAIAYSDYFVLGGLRGSFISNALTLFSAVAVLFVYLVCIYILWSKK